MNILILLLLLSSGLRAQMEDVTSGFQAAPCEAAYRLEMQKANGIQDSNERLGAQVRATENRTRCLTRSTSAGGSKKPEPTPVPVPESLEASDPSDPAKGFCRVNGVAGGGRAVINALECERFARSLCNSSTASLEYVFLAAEKKPDMRDAFKNGRVACGGPASARPSGRSGSGASEPSRSGRAK